MKKDSLRLEIVYKSIDQQIPYVNNARKHDEAQINEIASSIKEFGFNDPVALDGSRLWVLSIVDCITKSPGTKPFRR